MAYDLVPLKAPRAAGASLKALTAALENPVSGPLLLRRLHADNGIQALRETRVLAPLTAIGPHLALGAKRGSKPNVDLARVAAAAAETPGHRFDAIGDYAAAYRAGETDPVQVAHRLLEQTTLTEHRRPPLRLFIAQDRDDVLAQADAAARRLAAGRALGPLDGVPVAVKDELDQAGYSTTVGTTFLGTHPASRDATPVARLRAAGAVLVGKLNMHEIGLGVTGLNPHHGACRNPYDPGRATGGSSSGSGAAVGCGLVPLAVGADGGGSIRIPAALCGVFGLKATFGRISEAGAAPLCWSVAHVGPLAATARDLAIGYMVMAGVDPDDANTVSQPWPHLKGLGDHDLSGLRVGVYRRWFEDAESPVVTACRSAVEALERAGATVVDIMIPELGLLRTVHLISIASEMAAAHAIHYARHRREYGYDVRVLLATARSLTAADYVHAQRLRVRVCEHFARTLADVDVIATPATGRTAPLLTEDALETGESNLPLTDAIMRFAPAGNLTGLPAVSVPVGYDAAGLPIGLQLMGRAWDEATLLRLAEYLETTVERRAPRVDARSLALAPTTAAEGSA